LIAITTARPQSAAEQTTLLPSPSAGQVRSAAGRREVLERALAVIEAEDHAAAAAAEEKAALRDAQAESGQKITGRKPKTPHARLARARQDVKATRQRLADLQAARERKEAAIARREVVAGPRPCHVERAKATLAQAEQTQAEAEQAVKDARDRERRANVTDPDSRVMKSQKGWVQGYNAQALVSKDQIVIACQVSQDANDLQLYKPMITWGTDLLFKARVLRLIELVLADAGYWSEANATCPGPDRLIATLGDHKQRRAARERGTTEGPPPDGTQAEQMEHLLRTPQGTAAYAQRSHIVEPPFGDTKHNRNIRTFRRRGLAAVDSEWTLINLVGNLRKLHHHHTTPPPTPTAQAA
jgi:Transposase DDE domain